MIFKIRYINSWMLKVLLGTNASQQFGRLSRALLNIPFSAVTQTQGRTEGSRKSAIIQGHSPKPGDLHFTCPFRCVLNHVFQS